MKRFLGLMLALAMLISVFPIGSTQAASSDINSFVIHWGSPTYEQLQDMKKFDLAICDPSGLSNAQLKELQAAGVIVLGYIPTTSIDIQYPAFTGLQEQDYLWVNGQKVINHNDIAPDWLMDPRSAHFRQVVVNTIKQNIYARGYDGVFLDTLNQAPEYLGSYVSLDAASLNKLKDELMAASAQLCKEISEADSSKLVAQNNGWRELVNYTAPYLDFLMWEDYPYDLGTRDAWLNQKRDNLIKLRDQYQIKVLAAKFFSWNDYNGVQQFYNNARSYGFVPYAPWTSGVLYYDNVNTYDVPPRSTPTVPGQPTVPPGDTQAPSAPVITGAEVLSDSSIKLTWNKSADNVGVDHYDIYRKGFSYAKVATTRETTFIDTNLYSNTYFTYYIVAVDAAGNASARSNEVSAKTLAPGPPPDTQAPSAPVITGAEVLSDSSIKLTWNKSADNVGVDHYDIYRKGFSYAKVATTRETTFTDTNLYSNTYFTYYIVAVDAAGNVSARSNEVSARTLAPGPGPAPDTQAPSAPVITGATVLSDSSIKLTWNGATDNVGVDHYDIYRKGFSYAKVATTRETTFTDTNLYSNTYFTYYIVAVDAAGNASARSNEVSAKTLAPGPPPDTQAPSAPVITGAEVLSDSSIKLTWNKSADNVGVDHYDIYRKGFSYAKVATTRETTFTDTNLYSNTYFTYYIVAVDAAGNVSARSNEVSARTLAPGPGPAPDTQAPSAPVITGAVALSNSSIKLTWNKATDNVGVDHYDIYRKGFSFTKVATTKETSYTDTGLYSYTFFTYYIVAVDASGNESKPSNQLAVRTMR